MGLTFAPSFAQHLALYLISVVKHRLPNNNAYMTVWIDNFIFASNSLAALQLIEQTFRSLCEEVRLVLKPTIWGPKLTLLGATVDCTAGTISVTQEMQNNLQEALRNIIDIQRPTARAFAHWLGVVMFLNFAIRRTPLCHYHLTLDTLRSVARRGAWDSTISVSQALRKEMELVTEQHLAATWRLDMTCAPLNVELLRLLWTDASTHGLGGFVEETNGKPSQIFSEAMDIPQNRIFAYELLTGYLGSRLVSGSFAWMADNEAAARSIIKGHSASSRGDRILSRWWSTSNWPSGVCMVPTACQRSDGLSRGVLAIPPPCHHNHHFDIIATRCRRRLPGE
jgi:hypothetical protein